MPADARPQAQKNPRRIRWNTLRMFSSRERRRCLQIVCRSRMALLGQAPMCASHRGPTSRGGRSTDFHRPESIPPGAAPGEARKALARIIHESRHGRDLNMAHGRVENGRLHRRPIVGKLPNCDDIKFAETIIGLHQLPRAIARSSVPCLPLHRGDALMRKLHEADAVLSWICLFQLGAYWLYFGTAGSMQSHGCASEAKM